MTRNTDETMTPLAQCPRETLAAIEGVLTDIRRDRLDPLPAHR